MTSKAIRKALLFPPRPLGMAVLGTQPLLYKEALGKAIYIGALTTAPGQVPVDQP